VIVGVTDFPRLDMIETGFRHLRVADDPAAHPPLVKGARIFLSFALSDAIRTCCSATRGCWHTRRAITSDEMTTQTSDQSFQVLPVDWISVRFSALARIIHLRTRADFLWFDCR
jgi:hypothetical protein